MTDYYKKHFKEIYDRVCNLVYNWCSIREDSEREIKWAIKFLPNEKEIDDHLKRFRILILKYYIRYPTSNEYVTKLYNEFLERYQNEPRRQNEGELREQGKDLSH